MDGHPHRAPHQGPHLLPGGEEGLENQVAGLGDVGLLGQGQERHPRALGGAGRGLGHARSEGPHDGQHLGVLGQFLHQLRRGAGVVLGIFKDQLHRGLPGRQFHAPLDPEADVAHLAAQGQQAAQGDFAAAGRLALGGRGLRAVGIALLQDPEPFLGLLGLAGLLGHLGQTQHQGGGHGAVRIHGGEALQVAGLAASTTRDLRSSNHSWSPECRSWAARRSREKAWGTLFCFRAISASRAWVENHRERGRSPAAVRLSRICTAC